MSPPRVVSMGEALVDLLEVDGGERLWRAVPGGAPMNAAIAAARLGAPTTFLGVLSDDQFGDVLRSHLAASLVDHAHCPTTTEPTTLALVSAGEDGDFTFHAAGTTATSKLANDLHLPADVGIVHVSGSVAMVIELVASRLEGLLAASQHRALIHVDANPRPQIIGRDRYLRRFNHWLGLADVLKLSVDDIEWMSPGADPVQTAKHWVTPGEDGDHVPGVIVLTRGGSGATVIRDDLVIDVDAPSVDVVDTVGAGDTFAGAVLAALSAHHIASRDALDRLDGQWWRTAATYATKAATISCTRAGADPPRRVELT
ncbi:MAG: PfkB family carbohydrate kinase [Acidimicrobiales bacterium]|nr:PfkB family carbohydrate kinase [Acidimicrobiales bacterium]